MEFTSTGQNISRLQRAFNLFMDDSIVWIIKGDQGNWTLP